jgi:hypothetical protein
MKGGVKCADGRFAAVAHHHGNAAVVQLHLPRLTRRQPQQVREVDSVDNVVRNHQDRLAAVAFEQPIDDRENAVVDSPERFAARIAELRGIGVETWRIKYSTVRLSALFNILITRFSSAPGA